MTRKEVDNVEQTNEPVEGEGGEWVPESFDEPATLNGEPVEELEPEHSPDEHGA